jgi:predicted nuclease of restriction endonuclease-like (RecB) superfamily
MSNKLANTNNDEFILFEDLSQLIDDSKKQVAIQANSTLTLLFWQIGKRVNHFILNNKRAVYGKQVITNISIKLVNSYGRNFEARNLRRMLQFAQQFKDVAIVTTLSTQLSWSHITELLTLQKMEAKLFYVNKIKEEVWSVRELRKQKETKAYERALLANTQLPSEIKGTKNLFKDPYLLDFLNLKDDFLEKDLEQAILIELEKFILELGKGFTFVERQKRMIIDGEDFKLDLLFFYRKLKRLVVIELKIGKFKASYKGQMELYLKWLDKYEKQEGEETPIGLILCTETSKEQIELLEMHKDGIMVAEYWTELPSRNLLEQKIKEAVKEAKERLERRKIM